MQKSAFDEMLQFDFVFLQGYVLNPSTLWYNKSFDRELSTRVLIPLESGALDRSAILPCKLFCTLPFGLFAVVLPF